MSKLFLPFEQDFGLQRQGDRELDARLVFALQHRDAPDEVVQRAGTLIAQARAMLRGAIASGFISPDPELVINVRVGEYIIPVRASDKDDPFIGYERVD